MVSGFINGKKLCMSIPDHSVAYGAAVKGAAWSDDPSPCLSVRGNRDSEVGSVSLYDGMN